MVGWLVGSFVRSFVAWLGMTGIVASGATYCDFQYQRDNVLLYAP